VTGASRVDVRPRPSGEPAPGEVDAAEPVTAVTPRRLDQAAVLAVVIGVGLRAWLAWGANPGLMDPDEAVSGLMARHVIRGRFSTFYWGQAYGGTLEEVLIAPWTWLFGSNSAALRAAPVALGLAGVVLTWRLGRRLVGETAGGVAAALTAVWPLGNLYWSTRARGFYGVALVLVLAVALLAARLREPGACERGRADRRDWLLLGLLAGAAWWTSPLCMLVLFPTGLWLLAARRPGPADAARTGAAALVGAAPWLAANTTSGWASLATAAQGQPHNAYLDHLNVFLVRGFPLLLGLQVPLQSGWVVWRGLALALAVVLVVALAVALVTAAIGGPDRQRSRRLLVGVAVAYPFLLALSPYAYYLEDTRYLYLLHPFVALLLANVLVRYRVALVGLAIALGLTLAALPGFGDHDEADTGVLVPTLLAHGLTRVGADYSIAYPLMYLSSERIIATPIRGTVRSKALADQVRAAPEVAFVLRSGSPELRSFVAQLADPAPDRFQAGNYVVFIVDRDPARPFLKRQ